MNAPTQPRRSFRFGLFDADPSGELLRKGVRVKLQDQPFRLLIILLEHAGEIVSREELRQKLWPSNTYVEFDGSLNSTLKKLRAALGDTPENPTFIETIPKRGYRFIAPVAVSESQPASPEQPEGAEEARAARSAESVESMGLAGPAENRGGWRRSALGTSALILLALLVVASYHRLTSAGSDTPAGVTQPRNVTPRRSVAVLGFHNASGHPEDAWLSTALSEMLSTELAQGEKLRLVSGEDVAQLRLFAPWTQTDTLGQETTSRIGAALSSDVIVLGSYTTVGEAARRKIRVDVRLQEALSGNILTEVAETGAENDLFHLASVIGTRLRHSLGLPANTPGEQAGELASLPSNPEAARLYVVGLDKLREFDYVTARDLLQQAIAADPKFPLAHSMLSRACAFLGYDDKAKTEGKKGLDLAGGLTRVQRMEIEANYYEAYKNQAKGAEIYHSLFTLFPDSLDYGLQLAKLQQGSYQADAALETIRRLRRLPSPAGDDPRLDLRQGALTYAKDAQAADRLYRSAAAKALGQGKKLIYAKAEEMVCRVNAQLNPPECETAYEIFLAAGNRGEAAACLQIMAEAQRITGHTEQAIPLYEQALRVFKEAGDQERAGVTLNNLSLALENEGQWGRAEKNYREARQHFQAVNDQLNTAVATANIANMLVLRGRLREAAEQYRQAWEMGESGQSKRTESFHIGYGSVLLMQGDPKQARRQIEPQISSLRAYGGDPWQLANALAGLGDIQSAEGELAGARKNYQAAFDIFKRVGFPVAGVQVSLAESEAAEDRPEQAESLLHTAIADLEKNGSAGDEVSAYTALGRALLMEGKLSNAREAIAHAFKLADLREFPAIRLPIQIVQAKARAAGAKPGSAGHAEVLAAEHELRTILQSAQQLGLYKIEADARLALGELTMKSNPSRGRAQLMELADNARQHGFELVARKAVDLLNRDKTRGETERSPRNALNLAGAQEVSEPDGVQSRRSRPWKKKMVGAIGFEPMTSTV